MYINIDEQQNLDSRKNDKINYYQEVVFNNGNETVDDMVLSKIFNIPIDYEDDKKIIPIPSSHEDAFKKAKADADSFDYTSGILTFVDVDFHRTTTRQRRNHRMNARAVWQTRI